MKNYLTTIKLFGDYNLKSYDKFATWWKIITEDDWAIDNRAQEERRRRCGDDVVTVWCWCCDVPPCNILKSKERCNQGVKP